MDKKGQKKEIFDLLVGAELLVIPFDPAFTMYWVVYKSAIYTYSADLHSIFLLIDGIYINLMVLKNICYTLPRSPTLNETPIFKPIFQHFKS